MKKLSSIFGLLAIILTNVMCAVVGYNYATMLCGIKHMGFSAPANTAFLLAIPYLIGVVMCIVIALVLRKKDK